MTYNIGDIVRAPSNTDMSRRRFIPPEAGDLFRVTRDEPGTTQGVAVSGVAVRGRTADHEWYIGADWEVVTPAGTPDRPFAVGDRVRYRTSVPPGGSFNWNRDRAGWTGTIETVNAPRHVDVNWDNGNGTRGAAAVNLERIDAPAPAVPVTETLDSVWGVGNTIEFTVTGAFTGTNINVGCQSIRFADAQRTGVLRTLKSTGNGSNWNITFQVKIEDPLIITHPGGRFNKNDLRTYGRDFKLIEKAPEPEPEPEITITVTADEAARLRALTGQCNGSLTRVYGLLGGSGREADGGYRVIDVISDRPVNTLTLRK